MLPNPPNPSFSASSTSSSFPSYSNPLNSTIKPATFSTMAVNSTSAPSSTTSSVVFDYNGQVKSMNNNNSINQHLSLITYNSQSNGNSSTYSLPFSNSLRSARDTSKLSSSQPFYNDAIIHTPIISPSRDNTNGNDNISNNNNNNKSNNNNNNSNNIPQDVFQHCNIVDPQVPNQYIYSSPVYNPKSVAPQNLIQQQQQQNITNIQNMPAYSNNQNQNIEIRWIPVEVIPQSQVPQQIPMTITQQQQDQYVTFLGGTPSVQYISGLPTPPVTAPMASIQRNNLPETTFDHAGSGKICIREMTAELSESKKCPVCGKVCSRPSTLRTHYFIHTGDTPFKCTWPLCGKSFNVKSNMMRHMRTHSPRIGLKPPTKRSKKCIGK